MQWGIFREDEVSRWDWADTGRSSQTKGVGKEGRKGKPTVNYKGAGASANFEQIVFVNFTVVASYMSEYSPVKPWNLRNLATLDIYFKNDYDYDYVEIWWISLEFIWQRPL